MSVILFDSSQSTIHFNPDEDIASSSSSNSFGNQTVASANDSWGVGGDVVGYNVTQGYYYSPLFGTEIAIPEWEAVLTILSLR